MPSIIPSYIYTILASLIVGTLIISMVGLTTSNIKKEAEQQQLSNISDYVAAKSLELASSALVNNLSSMVSLDIPNLIGGRIYWIRISNDSSETWVEIGFGPTATQNFLQTAIPLEAFASGTYVSSSHCALLNCYAENRSIYLELSGGQ